MNSIAGSVNGIHGSLSSVLDVARQIRGDHGAVQGFGSGIAAINRRADTIMSLVQAIKADIGNVLAAVRNIEASAKSIDGGRPGRPVSDRCSSSGVCRDRSSPL